MFKSTKSFGKHSDKVVEESREEQPAMASSPLTMNAFDLISTSWGLKTNGML